MQKGHKGQKLAAFFDLYARNDDERHIGQHKRVIGFEISESTVSNVTNRVLEEAKEWQNRPLKEQ
ncbi:MAG: transposase [Endomicrobium sp.]|nr:transposase [Endomicrobium sp.]